MIEPPCGIKTAFIHPHLLKPTLDYEINPEITLATPWVRTEKYSPHWLRSKHGVDTVIFVCESVSENDIIDKLIEGYRKP